MLVAFYAKTERKLSERRESRPHGCSSPGCSIQGWTGSRAARGTVCFAPTSCAGYWFPSNPSTGTAQALCGTRGGAAPGFGGQEASVGVSVHVLMETKQPGDVSLVQGQSPAAFVLGEDPKPQDEPNLCMHAHLRAMCASVLAF